MKRLLAFGTVLAALSISSIALADDTDAGYTTNDVEGGYQVDFTDDPLNAKGVDATGVTIKGRPQAARIQLIRPRTSFRSELLKTVESL